MVREEEGKGAAQMEVDKAVRWAEWMVAKRVVEKVAVLEDRKAAARAAARAATTAVGRVAARAVATAVEVRVAETAAVGKVALAEPVEKVGVMAVEAREVERARAARVALKVAAVRVGSSEGEVREVATLVVARVAGRAATAKAESKVVVSMAGCLGAEAREVMMGMGGRALHATRTKGPRPRCRAHLSR